MIEPFYNENIVSIAMSSSKEYVPYLSVCLQSLKEHSSLNCNYDIIVFERGIDEENKNILKNQICSENISLRFVNPMEIISQYSLEFPEYYNLECYFRLTAPLILKNYSKIIFTDIDLIFEKDIKDLYKTDIPNALGAVQDLVFCAFCDTDSLDCYKYATEELELSNPYKYFNTGVMLLNLEYMRNNNIPQKLLKMSSEKMYRILEQDVLNKFFKEDITYLDDIWNFPTMNLEYSAFMKNLKDKSINTRYDNARISPGIIHWAGKGKAWNDPNTDFAYKWWEIARKTPFYEIILDRYFENKQKSLLKTLEEKINTLEEKTTANIMEYWRVKFLYNITFGKKKQHYLNKMLSLKKNLNL